ncbi:hypothetical protein [Pseudomonas putida]
MVDRGHLSPRGTPAKNPHNAIKHQTLQNISTTQENADARAREILNQFPTAQTFIFQILKEYSAKVTVTAKDPVTSAPEPEAPSV